MWRVFWMPPDAVRTGVRRRVLAGWDDLPLRENRAGIRAGDPILLSPEGLPQLRLARRRA